MTYAEKLKDPRWQKKRLQILERDEWMCQSCQDNEKPLHVHHLSYDKGVEPWDYPAERLLTLCHECHEREKDERSKVEQNLLKAIKDRGFMSADVFTLFHIFSRLEMPYPPEVIATALEWFFVHGEGMETVTKAYFKHIADKKG